MSKKTELPETIYYTDPLNDEFSTMQIETPLIDGKYKYKRDGFLGSVLHFLTFYLIGKPLAFIYLKSKFHHRIKGKGKLKQFKKESYFLYGNHTQIIGDALMPAFMVSPRSMSVIVHPNNTAIPFIGKFVPYLGGMPLPADMAATKHFMAELDYRVKKKKHPIVIYPEAHLWPYYNDIRPFKSTSFTYPIQYGTPAFCFVNTYQKGKKGKVNITTYIRGPFYAKEGLPLAEAREDLRNQIYRTMKELAEEYSDYAAINYIKKEDR